ncbi:helix-turn-helix domain-containing protein [Ectopseudomonas mendocina]|uniref:Helix-turn-helix domain-containing protein n=1 Tax=Ectopseudomonas mendocina TaxID=300 RepID=A0ABZ2RFR9_ECTME
MRRTSFEDMNCPIARSLDLIGDWWTLLILRNAFCGIRHFQDFQNHLGISSGTLTNRLQRLTDQEILERLPNPTDGRVYEYELSEKGRQLFPLLLVLTEWGERWLPHPQGRRIRLVKRDSGQAITGLCAIAEDGSQVALEDIVALPGPAADEDTWVLINAQQKL